MVTLKEITSFLDTYLAIHDITDNCWNGLQFEGALEFSKIVLAVDAGIETFTAAVKAQAHLLIVHHPHFWTGTNPAIVGWSKQRLALLFTHNLSLYVAHLPLDRHREVGNNAQILRLLGAKIVDEFLHEGDKNIGWIGRLPAAVPLPALAKKLNQGLATSSVVLPHGPATITTVAVVSGSGGYAGFAEAVAKRVDLYITGDTSEVYHTAKDAGINVIFAGHHATETVGLKALADVLTKKFPVETEFIDIPTGL